jgi:hypothetical protein
MADIGDIINANASRTLAPAAVGSQVALMSIISASGLISFYSKKLHSRLLGRHDCRIQRIAT